MSVRENEWRYQVLPSEAEASLAKAEKLLAKAQKKGLEGGYQVAIETDPEGKVELVVSGTPYKVNGWEFVAVVNWLPNGEYISSKSPFYEGAEIDSESVNANSCDSCGVNRQRNTQIVVENAEGERKVLGSTCTKDFLGWVYSPVTFNFEDEIEESFGRGGGVWSARTQRVLAVAIALSKVRSSEDLKSRVVNVLLQDKDAEKVDPNPYYDEAQEIITKAREWFNADTAKNDFEQNVASALTGEFTYWQTIGLIVCLVKVAKNQEAKDAREQAKAELEADITETTQYAETGTKFQIQAKVIDKFGFEGAYGWVTIFTFSAEGYRFKWFSTGNFDAEIEQVVQLKGTVKGLDDYQGKISTVITRCSEVKPKAPRVKKNDDVEYEL